MSSIEVNHLSFSYQKDHSVLEDLSFRAQGSVGLIGANGAGKSTLLKLLVGLETGFSGEIRVDGLPLTKATLPEIRTKLGYVFQDSETQLFLTTVREDVAFGPRNSGLSPDQVEQRVEQALAETGISHLARRPIYQLSGGEKKLAAIATILSMSPEMLLLDEPSAALDPRSRRRLIHLLNGLPQLKLMASHDLDMILETCETTILLSEGKVVSMGPTEQLLTDQALLEAHSLELPFCFQRPRKRGEA